MTLPTNTEAGKESVLLIHPIGYDRSGQNKSLRDEELRNAEHLSTTKDLTVHFGQCISTKKDPFVRNISSLNAYWQTIYVYARIIRYVIDFSAAVGKRTSLNELLNFFKKQFWRPPTVICLIERAADNLINFHAVVKKRLSKFELLRCCRISNSGHRQTS